MSKRPAPITEFPRRSCPLTMTSEVVPEPRAHNEYSVGWVCALPKEQTAATAMLDQRHASLSKPLNDHNTYTLGSIGKHNIVIACLPKGKTGNTSAATIATSMISTFPAIRFSLMVGIGGGIPPKVRLGDVVVSTPVGQYPGVVQWDCKVNQAGNFERTGSLNNPPNALLTALTKMETDYELTGSRIPEYLNELEDKWPRLVLKYLRSDSLEDILFDAGYVHVAKSTTDCTMISDDDKGEDEADGEDDCRFCDKALAVKRKPREMRVHYGLIASGNALIKDAGFRDKLNQDLGGQVLCVEMDAAGLAHAFPCIIIRGICDYADSHKNEAWQEHAAAVAAAFAKELLDYVQPSDVKGEPMAKDILSQIRNTILRTEANIQEVKSKFDEKEDMEIFKWLTPINYGPQHSDHFSQRQEGTGEWLLRSKAFQEWVETDEQTLFCHGVPGAGKTILTSIVINNLITRFGNIKNTGIAYIYGDFRRQDEQKARNLLENLLKQLAQGRSTLPDNVRFLHDKYKDKGMRPSSSEILEALHSVVGLYSQVFIIVDALDELQANGGCRTRFLEEIFDLQAKCRVKLFATSRFIPEITEGFKDSATFEIRAHDEDVRQYLDGRISQSGQKLLQLHRDEIKTEISRAVDGMFLLAQLHFDSVATKKTLKKMKNVLNNLSTGPRAYDLAYEKAMERIIGQHPDSEELAKQVLLWVICAKRILNTEELQHALAVEVGEHKLDEENLPQIEDMVSVCAGLVTVEKESNAIRLVHYTTQEYFDRTQKQWFPDAQSDITTICVTYLSFGVFESGDCISKKEFEDRLLENPFYDYAARNWGHHALTDCMDGDQLILRFLESEAKSSASFQAIMGLEFHRLDFWPDWRKPMRATGLHAAAYFGLSHSVLALLQNGHNADPEDGLGWTPLLYAARHGCEAVVELLIARNDVDPNSNDPRYGRTPLSWAARGGHEAIVRMLLGKKGIIPDFTSNEGSPLLLAARNGHGTVVKLLLSRDDVDPNSTDWEEMTPLSRAAKNGHEGVVKLLLDKKSVHPDFKSRHNRTPLSWAAEKGHTAVVRMLLATDGVDSNYQDWNDQTPLLYAVEGGHEVAVKLLVAKKTVNWSNGLLGAAAEKGHEAILKLLATSSTIPDSQDRVQTPALQVTEEGGENLMPILSGNSSPEGTTLHWAAENGRLAVVRTLLQEGASVDEWKVTISERTSRAWTIHSRQRETALHLAVRHGHKAIVSLLLDHGANINNASTVTTTSMYGGMNISTSNTTSNRFVITNQSIDERWQEYVDKNSGGRVVVQKRTAIYLAAWCEYKAIVILLLERGARVYPLEESASGHSSTPDP